MPNNIITFQMFTVRSNTVGLFMKNSDRWCLTVFTAVQVLDICSIYCLRLSEFRYVRQLINV